MKVRSSLKTLKTRHRDCKLVRRKGRLYVINKTKAEQRKLDVLYVNHKQIAVAGGVRAGLLRPITLWPFPYAAVEQAVGRAKAVLVVEMNAGQMVEDVKLSTGGTCEVLFYGRPGGAIITPEEVEEQILQLFNRQPHLVTTETGLHHT